MEKRSGSLIIGLRLLILAAVITAVVLLVKVAADTAARNESVWWMQMNV